MFISFFLCCSTLQQWHETKKNTPQGLDPEYIDPVLVTKKVIEGVDDFGEPKLEKFPQKFCGENMPSDFWGETYGDKFWSQIHWVE